MLIKSDTCVEEKYLVFFLPIDLRQDLETRFTTKLNQPGSSYPPILMDCKCL